MLYFQANRLCFILEGSQLLLIFRSGALGLEGVLAVFRVAGLKLLLSLFDKLSDRIEQQKRQTARQYDEVQHVQQYLNKINV